jgi:hypothetical protein
MKRRYKMEKQFLKEDEDDKEIFVAFIIRTTERRWRFAEKEILAKAGTVVYAHRCPTHKKLKIVEVPP